jgi:glutamine synthetase
MDCERELGGPRYSRAPYVFYIMNNSEHLLGRVVDKFGRVGFFPKVGLEVEFYALEVDHITPLAVDIGNFTRDRGISCGGVAAEIGTGQFEVGLNPYGDMARLVGDFELLKSFLLESRYGVSFSTMPFYDQPRSALQINITLNDVGGKNLFAKDSDDRESRILLNSVAGLLETTNSFLPLYIESEEDLLAYDLEFNSLIFAKRKNQAPTYNSWGLNNRSCSIRIPTSKKFYFEREYRMDNLLNRRIEFRVAASGCNLSCALFGVLYGVLYGIQNNREPPPATSNNVLEHHEGYRKIFIEDNLRDILHPSIFNDELE